MEWVWERRQFRRASVRERYCEMLSLDLRITFNML